MILAISERHAVGAELREGIVTLVKRLCDPTAELWKRWYILRVLEALAEYLSESRYESNQLRPIVAGYVKQIREEGERLSGAGGAYLGGFQSHKGRLGDRLIKLADSIEQLRP